MAATLQEAIDDIVEDIGVIGTSIPLVATRITTWLNSMFVNPALFPPPGAAWNQESILQRSVYDWAVPTLEARAEIQRLALISGSNVQIANIAIDVVSRTLLAVQAAATANRITANQVTSVVTAYTAAWE